MSKTAMQELYGKFYEQNTVSELFLWIVENKDIILEKEKQQIIEAWNNSTISTASDDTGEDYYNQTYIK